MEMESRECLCVLLSTVLQSEGLITGYLSGPSLLLTCSSGRVVPLLISVSPPVLSSHSLHTPSPYLTLTHFHFFFSFPITAEVKRKATIRKFSFWDDWLLLSRLSNDIFTLEVQHFLQRESAFEMSTYLKLEMTLTYSSHFFSLHWGRGM